MILAYITADRGALMSVFSDPDKFYNADPFTFLDVIILDVYLQCGLFLGG